MPLPPMCSLVLALNLWTGTPTLHAKHLLTVAAQLHLLEQCCAQQEAAM